MKMRYIIVDDESAAHRNIENFAINLPFLEKEGNCFSAIEAMAKLSEIEIDLMFLDINMPMMSGFDLIRTLSKTPAVIITTAYQEYALEGYELDVVDYLLKPFSFERFLKSVNKVKKEGISDSSPNVENDAESLFIKENKVHHQVLVKDILFLEARGNYVKIQMLERYILTYSSLSNLLKSLPESRFIQAHKSFAVAIPHIRSLEASRIKIAEFEVPVGLMFKKRLIARLNIN